ncbi:MAG: sigma-70 family RNA polymerase sigma factor [Gemmatimonadales bacterium]|nr:sigma-70 family RNA polymerase sigma factor [Gemmatimonadales bacterium]NIN13174.1 sigma-70 family RNA polymerase sigma factor [Gemmatimonadales bacterium]NIN51452.1 sigma-70 family RNA polymerase sigma factor [Gemmatimonadales bacterium]NIP08916.1 sigma-70 family RNA polymerase sigma factor [Gemmatimonadales bacterium]NIR03704.1 sigma-70 family RNA polymerase sigma factor [Gemmatimonadales bacterium]
MDDRELTALAAAFQRGDEGSFKLLVDALTRTLIAMAYRYIGDWEWARDLTQETWIRVYDRIRRYDPARSFRAWVLAVHRNGCLSHLRRAWVRQETTPGDEVIKELPIAHHGRNPEEDLERSEFHRRLLVALGELSESQRLVFVRVDLEQEDQKEVAQDLGIKPATLRATLHFARKRLASVLRQSEESQ